MRNVYAENPSRTRIREFGRPETEFIAEVSVHISHGSVGVSRLELERIATEALVEYIRGIEVDDG